MRSIADGLYNLCLKKGVHFEFNQHIKSIRIINNNAYKINNTNQQFKTVIYNGDSAQLYKLLNEPKKATKTTKNERSTSGVVYYWQVKGNIKKLGLHNILFSDNYRQEFKDIAAGKLPKKPTIYINITSKYEPKMAKPGYENWFVMINAPAGLAQTSLKALRQTVINRVESILGTKIEIDVEDVLTPNKIQERDNAYTGAIYGQSSNNPKTALFKQPNIVRGYPNLFCVGGTVHPGGGVPLSVRSAKIVAGLL
jgi:phytoene dehydrogenase-like protein